MSFWSVVVNGSPVDFSTLGLYPSREFSGAGMPPISHNIQSYALQPGALYQSSKVQPRTLVLKIDLEGSSYANMHTLRQALINIFAPTTPYYTPEVRIYYTGGTRAVYADFRYLGGLDWVGYTGFNQLVPLQLVATDPHWYEDDAETFSLGGQGSLANANYVVERLSGTWNNMDGGTSDSVYAIASDTANNRFCIGGIFNEAGGISYGELYCVMWWSNTYQRWEAVSATMSESLTTVINCIAIAANGDIWIGTGEAVVRYNDATDEWSNFAANGTVNAIAIAPNGTVYIGGAFTDFQGSGANYIASYFNSTWASLGNPTKLDVVNAIAIASDNTIYAGGQEYSTTESYVYKRSGTTWTQIAVLEGSNPYTGTGCLIFDTANNLYIGGYFTSVNGIAANNIARYDGAVTHVLGAGLSGGAEALLWSGGVLYASVYGLLVIRKWNGTGWYDLPGTFPEGASITAISAIGSTVLAGFNLSGTMTIPSSEAVTPVSTAPVFPVITLTLASGSAALASITNETTGHVIYLEYTLAAGETLTIDLSPGKKTITSSSAGAIPYAILEGSDLANFCLIGAVENTITVASNNSDVNATLTFQTAHWSIDGGSS